MASFSCFNQILFMLSIILFIDLFCGVSLIDNITSLQKQENTTTTATTTNAQSLDKVTNSSISKLKY